MNSLKSGGKNLLSRTKIVITFALKNCKLELLIIILGIIWMSLSCYFPGEHQKLVDFFDDSRCSGILGYTSVIIGIYVTVWSIFATSAARINEEILKTKVEGQMFFLIGVNLLEAFVTTVFCAFVPTRAALHYTEILSTLTVLTTVSFIKFIVLVMLITKLNIKYIVQEIDEQNSICTEVRVKLDEVYQRTIDSKK